MLHAVQRHPKYIPYIDLKVTDLFYALPRGVLVLFFGDHRFPNGTTAPGSNPSCPKTAAVGCRETVGVIGCENCIYYPAERGGPGQYEGLRMSFYSGGELGPLDRIARRAYCDNGVGGAWEMPWGFW